MLFMISKIQTDVTLNQTELNTTNSVPVHSSSDAVLDRISSKMSDILIKRAKIIPTKRQLGLDNSKHLDLVLGVKDSMYGFSWTTGKYLRCPHPSHYKLGKVLFNYYEKPKRLVRLYNRFKDRRVHIGQMMCDLSMKVFSMNYNAFLKTAQVNIEFKSGCMKSKTMVSLVTTNIFFDHEVPTFVKVLIGGEPYYIRFKATMPHLIGNVEFDEYYFYNKYQAKINTVKKKKRVNKKFIAQQYRTMLNSRKKRKLLQLKVVGNKNMLIGKVGFNNERELRQIDTKKRRHKIIKRTRREKKKIVKRELKQRTNQRQKRHRPKRGRRARQSGNRNTNKYKRIAKQKKGRKLKHKIRYQRSLKNLSFKGRLGQEVEEKIKEVLKMKDKMDRKLLNMLKSKEGKPLKIPGQSEWDAMNNPKPPFIEDPFNQIRKMRRSFMSILKGFAAFKLPPVETARDMIRKEQQKAMNALNAAMNKAGDVFKKMQAMGNKLIPKIPVITINKNFTEADKKLKWSQTGVRYEIVPADAKKKKVWFGFETIKDIWEGKNPVKCNLVRLKNIKKNFKQAIKVPDPLGMTKMGMNAVSSDKLVKDVLKKPNNVPDIVNMMNAKPPHMSPSALLSKGTEAIKKIVPNPFKMKIPMKTIWLRAFGHAEIHETSCML